MRRRIKVFKLLLQQCESNNGMMIIEKKGQI